MTERAPELWVGCPMWANRDWIGRWFPRDTPTGDELEVYATWCNAVEGNTTFYAVPDATVIRRWADLAPPGFRFVFKLPRTITHDRRLRHADHDLASFLERITPLRTVCGPVSVQLPASFGPEDLDTLDGFCAGLSLDWTWAVEVRHAEFAAGGTAEHRLHDLLRRHGVDRIILDSRPLFAAAPVTPAEREAWDRKPRLAVRPVALGWEPVVRIIGNSDPHDTIARWEPWIPKVASWLAEGRHPTVFLHTPDNLLSPPLARRFHADVAAAFTELTGRSIAALPAPATADQPSLF